MNLNKETFDLLVGTPQGAALVDFIHVASSLGLGEGDIWTVGCKLAKEWDGTETLAQMYQRMEVWPIDVEV